MARRSSRRPRREASFIFQFLGWNDGWYVLRANTGRPHTPRASHAYENTVLEWLIEQGITPNVQSYLANGNTGDGPRVPAADDGHFLCLLLRRPTDLIRFDMAFRCRGITAEALLAAIRSEASVHRFVLYDIGVITYGAVAQLSTIVGEQAIDWDSIDDDTRQLHLQMVREYLEHPDWIPERLHQAWVDTRLIEGWKYGATIDLAKRQHPSLVPFGKLSANDQAKIRLFTGMVASLAALL